MRGGEASREETRGAELSRGEMSDEFSEHLAKIYYPKTSRRTGEKTAKVFWNEAYSIDSVGVTKLDILIRYVKSQPRELLDKVTRGESLESD